jgi:predicted O-methyltransferase YrrM
MYTRSALAAKYLKYYITAFNGKGHGMHSPFVFDFIRRVLNDSNGYPEYDRVEALRKHLLHDSRKLIVEDMGAGSSFGRKQERTISSIARNAAKPKKWGQLLFRIARYYKPAIILELGTSLGITSSYLSLAASQSKLVTIEGSGEIARVARENFEKLELKNISLVEGNFDQQLPLILSDLTEVDLAFIDGNHRREPTENYFRQLLPKLNNNSLLIFDDIHWSEEMEFAWNSIQKHTEVRCTIDLFFIGIVIFRQEFHEKQHFSIRF